MSVNIYRLEIPRHSLQMDGMKRRASLGSCKETVATYGAGMSNREIVSALQKLPERRREAIATALLEKVRTPSRRSLHIIWAREAESRVDRFLRGKSKTIPADQVLAGLR